jgi:sirohydrochlorin cobaltochelatase
MTALSKSSPIVILVGHGSREPSGSAEFKAWVDAYHAERPELDIRYGFVELADPKVGEVLELAARECSMGPDAGDDEPFEGSGTPRTAMTHKKDIVVIPVSLLAAGHVKNELPIVVSAIAQKYPDVRIELTRALGVHPLMVEAVTAQTKDLWASLPAEEKTESLLMVVGRGSSDPDANSDFFKITRLIAEGMEMPRVLSCFMGITTPKVEETFLLATRLRPKHMVVVPYLLFSGVLLKRLQEQVQTFAAKHPWTKVHMIASLASQPALSALIDERIAGAFGKSDPLPCTTCQYRVPIGAIAGKVGGLEALLWSVRHSYTHTQAAPHTHAHTKVKKHILVCTNTECANKGSVALVEKLRRELRAKGLDRSFKITRTSCMSRCGEGPTVVVYPDGIWYRSVEVEDTTDLIEEHLLAGRLVARRVDTIM